jgi:hypothetical protein
VSLYTDTRDAIQAVWTANWPHAANTPPVLWHSNLAPQVPDIGTAAHWLLLAVEFGQDQIAAYGAGRLANDRRLSGSVVVRVFAAHGTGEDTALDLLSDAVAALRSRRDGPLSFIGAITGIDDGGSDDGNWWLRAAVIAFEYRHAG